MIVEEDNVPGSPAESDSPLRTNSSGSDDDQSTLAKKKMLKPWAK